MCLHEKKKWDKTTSEFFVVMDKSNKNKQFLVIISTNTLSTPRAHVFMKREKCTAVNNVRVSDSNGQKSNKDKQF